MTATTAKTMIATRRLSTSRAFTLLEMVIVLAITAMLLSAIFSIAQGTITLADDIQKHQRRESRLYSYIDFCQRMLSDLPATAALNIQTAKNGSGYLSTLELQNISSPFDGAPQQIVTLKSSSLAGGGMRLVLSSQRMPDPLNPSSDNRNPVTQVELFDNLVQYEWRAFDYTSAQWVSIWKEQLPDLLNQPLSPAVAPPGAPTTPVAGAAGAVGTPGTGVAGTGAAAAPALIPAVAAPAQSKHPLMLELTLAAGIDNPRRWVFWIPPSDLPVR